mgnify:CR=1 FL=1
MTWVLLKKYCELSGESRDSFNSKRRRALVAEGLHYRKSRDGRIWVNIEEMERWVKS